MKVDCQSEQLIVPLVNLLGPVIDGSCQLLPLMLNIFTLGCFFHLMVPIMQLLRCCLPLEAIIEALLEVIEADVVEGPNETNNVVELVSVKGWRMYSES